MKIAVFGLGISSIGVLHYLKSSNNEVFVVNRDKLELWENKVQDISERFVCVHENRSEDIFENSDLIILSPGVPRNHVKLKKALLKKVPVESEIEFTFKRSKVPVIAVTGSNGKTTTCTMIKESLEKFGKKIFLGGNIGYAYSNILKNDNFDYAVIETSSFQLESIETFSPKISVITNITPNHMERYSSFEDYKNAKLNILKNNPSIVLATPSLKIEDAKSIIPLESFDFSKSKLVGKHNQLNFFCAHEVCKELCENYDQEIFQDFINKFKAVKFRLEYVGNKNTNEFYNDSKSTNIESTLNAIKAFEITDKLVVILGGKLRKQDAKEFAVLNEFKNCEFLSFGEARKELFKVLQSKEYLDLESLFKDLDQYQNKKIIFSPGFPSFDQFKNFEERGKYFNKLFKMF